MSYFSKSSNKLSPSAFAFLQPSSSSPTKNNENNVRLPKRKLKFSPGNWTTGMSPPTSRRKPLGFLSPNTFRKRPAASSEKQPSKEENLKDQIVELQQKIETLNVNTDSHADLIQNQVLTTGPKEYQLHVLAEKLSHIQQGLAEIEQERQSLVEKVSTLEYEKKSILTELECREKELATLSRRCAIQADKMKETTKLRSARDQLAQKVNQLQAELVTKQQDKDNIVHVQRELEHCKASRDSLMEKSDRLTKEYDEVSGHLRVSLIRIEELTEEKRNWEEERRRLHRRAELEVEQQRVEYARCTVSLQQDLRVHQVEVEKLVHELKSKEAVIAQMQNHIEDFRKQSFTEINELRHTHEMRVTEISATNQEELKRLTQEYERDRNILEAKIQEKENVVTSLESEVSSHMEKLMTVTSELAKLEEDSKLLDSLTSDVESLEHERCCLSETIHERDTEICELSAEIIKLELEKELQHQEITKLQKSIEKFEQLGADNASLDAELLVAKRKITELEEALRLSHEDKDNERNTFQSQKALLEIELKEALKTLARKQTQSDESYQNILAERENHIRLLKQEVRECTDEFSLSTCTFQKEIERLKEELDKSKQDLLLRDDEIRELRMVELHEHEITIAKLRKEFVRLNKEMKKSSEEASKMQTKMEAEIASLRKQSHTMEASHLETKKHYQNELDEMHATITELKHEKSCNDIAIHDYETALESKATEIQSLSTKLQDADEAYRRQLVEYRALRTSVQEIENERDSLRAALENERSSSENKRVGDLELREQYERLQRELRNNEEKLIFRQDQMAALEAAVQERTKLQIESAAQCKEMEAKLTQFESKQVTIEEENQQLRSQISDKEKVILTLKKEMGNKEDQFADEIEDERIRRELAESDLDSANRRLEALRQERKSTADLRKENEELRNKIQRQEAFLKRKLEKEKAQRDRGGLNAVRKPSTTRSVVSSPKKSRSGTVSTRGTTTTSSDSQSFEFDPDVTLDSLLAD